jgi:hypothetical protein
MSLLRHIDGDPCPRFGDELPAHKELPAHTSPELLAHKAAKMETARAALEAIAQPPVIPAPLVDTTKARGRGRPPQSEAEAVLAEARRRAKNKERMAAKRKAKS